MLRGFNLDWYDFTQLLSATQGTREEVRDLLQQSYAILPSGCPRPRTVRILPTQLMRECFLGGCR